MARVPRAQNVLPMLIVLVLLMVGTIMGCGSRASSGRSQDGMSSLSVASATPSLYAVTFQESGLPSGTLWQVGTAPVGSDYFAFSNSTGSTIQQQLPNGTYGIEVSTPANYSQGLNQTQFTVAGKPLTLSIPFSAGNSVTFLESGLPLGTAWYVTLRNSTSIVNLSSVQGSLMAFEPAGSYNYSTYAESYTSTPATGTLTVPSSEPAVVNLTFVPTPVGYLDGIITVETAQLWIDGVPHGFTAGGGFSFGVAPGVHTIIVSALGYQTFSGYAVVKSGQTTNVYIELLGDSSTPPPPTPREFTTTDEAIMLGLAIAVIALAASIGWIWVRGRDRPRSPTPTAKP